MKPVLFTVLSALLLSCVTEQEIQADMIEATLVKIEDANRYPDIQRKMLTWKTSNNLTYITYEREYTYATVGMIRSVMVKK